MPDKNLPPRAAGDRTIADAVIAAVASTSPVEPRGRVVSAGEHVVEIEGLSAFGTVGGPSSSSIVAARRSWARSSGSATNAPSSWDCRRCQISGPAAVPGSCMPPPKFIPRGPGCRGYSTGPEPSSTAAALLASDRRAIRCEPPRRLRHVGVWWPNGSMGIAALNTFVTCCRGQRLGIFAGSGVGKTTLLGMLTRNVEADAVVIALVGERGKELSEFLERYLPEDVRRRTVVVISTSDQTAILRRRAVLVATAVAEKFRDDGLHVAFFLDSLTRYAMALREIGLAAGEPAGPSGYPASVFAELPKIVERLGPGKAARRSRHSSRFWSKVTI